ncbi:MAG: hypothetical protein JO363_12040 [Solirubrobacterales bacterium]|nr:hypothetical protein [Solirubrobacterales bacterium]
MLELAAAGDPELDAPVPRQVCRRRVGHERIYLAERLGGVRGADVEESQVPAGNLGPLARERERKRCVCAPCSPTWDGRLAW